MLKEFFTCHRCLESSGMESAPANGDERFVLPGNKPQYAPDRDFKAEHLKLELWLDLPGKRFRGRAALTFRAFRDAQTISLDAVHFKIRKAAALGLRSSSSYKDPKLTVMLAKPLKAGQRVTVLVEYEVIRPKLGMFFVGPDASDRKKEVQAWTQGEDEYARYWFPCPDAPQERLTTELIVTIPKGMTAVSNGRLVRKTARGRNAVFHWKQDVPHATYLVSLVVGRFSELKDRWKRVPVVHYVPKGREADGWRAFGKTPKMIDFFSRKIGVPYAFAKYAQTAALDFIYGGMENTSATTQTAMTLHDERAHLDFRSDDLVAHELAHQWFGDLLTCKDWSHAWLNESFATYFDALFQEHDLGADEFAWQMHENAQAYFDEDKNHYRRPIVTSTYRQPGDLFDRHLYEKGSCVLHMLRGELGERDFWRAIHRYVENHHGQVVETVDLINAIQETTGRNVRRFFDQWIYGAGHPEFKVRFWWDSRKKELAVRVAQTQKGTTFTPAISFVFLVKGKTIRETRPIQQKSHLFRFKLKAEPDLVLFDPDHRILKRVDIVKPEAMWIRQLEKDPHPIGRLEAAKALGQRATAGAIEALSARLLKEKFWGTAQGIAETLGNIRHPGAMEGLLTALNRVRHPKIRRGIYPALARFSDPRAAMEIERFFDSEPSWFAEAEGLKALAKSSPERAVRVVENYLRKDSWNDILRVNAVEALAALKTPNLTERLWAFSGPAYRLPVRLTALRMLESTASPDALQPKLLGLLGDPNFRVRFAAARLLKNAGDERALPALKKLLDADEDGRLKRLAQEAIHHISKGIEEKP